MSAPSTDVNASFAQIWTLVRPQMCVCLPAVTRYVFNGFSYLMLADAVACSAGAVIGRRGRCCGHSALINCHQLYDSAVAERVLSVHYHSSITFSTRDVWPLCEDLSQTPWIFIRRPCFSCIQRRDAIVPNVPIIRLFKGEIIHTDQLLPSTD